MIWFLEKSLVFSGTLLSAECNPIEYNSVESLESNEQIQIQTFWN